MTSFLVGKSGGKAIMAEEEDVKLTLREEEVYFMLVTTPLKKVELAKELCISPATINTHITSILRKKEVSSIRELIIKHYNQLIQKEIKQEEI